MCGVSTTVVPGGWLGDEYVIITKDFQKSLTGGRPATEIRVLDNRRHTAIQDAPPIGCIRQRREIRPDRPPERLIRAIDTQPVPHLVKFKMMQHTGVQVVQFPSVEARRGAAETCDIENTR